MAPAQDRASASDGAGAQDRAGASDRVQGAADLVVLDLLKGSGALLEGHFQLSSGLHSPNYVQCARLLESPRRAETAGRLLANRVRDLAIDLVVGPALGGIVIAHEVARDLGMRCFFTERVNGEMALRRGFDLRPGDRVLVVEDVITTGKSSLEVRDVIERAGARVVSFASIVNRLGAAQLGGLALRRLVPFDLVTYEPGNCPLCAAGDVVVKPGSRTAKQQSSEDRI